MRSFLRLSLIIGLFCITLTSLARFIGQHLPPSDRLTRLHLSECAPPCWAGFVPGETKLDTTSAQKRLETLFPSTDYDIQAGNSTGFEFSFTVMRKEKILNTGQDKFDVAFRLMADEKTIYAVTLYFAKQARAPSMGDLSVVFGSPTCIMSEITSGQVIEIIYQDLGQQRKISAGLTNQSWLDPLFYIDYLLPATVQNCIGLPPWRGLASFEKYMLH